MDEATHQDSGLTSDAAARKRRVLVIDDSPMIQDLVRDILTSANYEVTSASNATEGLQQAIRTRPDLILLDYVLPEIKGDEVARQLGENSATSGIRVLFMSGHGADLQPDATAHPNVIGVLNKPFTSDLLIKTVESHIPKSSDDNPAPVASEPANEMASAEPPTSSEASFMPPETFSEAPAAPEPAPVATADDEWWSAPQSSSAWSQPSAPETRSTSSAAEESNLPNESVTHGAYFSGDTRFFSLNWALQAIGEQKLSGALRLFWDREPIDLIAENGQVVLVTTRDANGYCSDSPITLTNVDSSRIEIAREQQRATGTPMFLTLAQDGSILQEPAVQLVQHYGQKLFAQLWSARRVRFMFEPGPLPDYARDLPREDDIDNWALATLRSVQLQDLGNDAEYNPASIPAYTKDGFERVQNLKLTVAEAQFASQFNGARSIAQIAKNLRLDIKFARVTLFRFIALEIVECWPPTVGSKTERKGFLSRFGIGD